MANVDYGIKEIMLAPATATGAYPDFETEGHVIPMIVMDSFQQEKEDDQTTDINWEDFDDVGLVLEGVKGKKTITFQTNDLSNDQYKYLTGASVDTGGWLNEGVAFSLAPQAMQVTTRAIDTFPSKIHQWAKLKVEVKDSGSLGKNGLPNLTLKMTKVANTNAAGKEIAGKRTKEVA